MKNLHNVTSPLSAILLWLAAGAVLFPYASVCSASSILTYDADTGNVIQIDQEIKKDPARLKIIFEDAIRKGSLSPVGAFIEVLSGKLPEDATIRAIAAIYFASSGDLEKARSSLKTAALLKETLYSRVAAAMIKQREKHFQEAIQLCQEAISMDKTHPYPWNVMGRIHLEMGDNGKALTSFRSAVQLEPAFLPGHLNLGAVYYFMNDFVHAAESFQKVLALDPHNKNALYGLGLAYDAFGQISLARDAYKQYLQQAPEDLEVLSALARLQIVMRDYEAARKTAATLLSKNTPGAALLLGNAQMHLGDFPGALETLQKADNADPAVRILAGLCKTALGRYSEALTDMEVAVKLHTDTTIARAGVASLQFHFNPSPPAATPLEHYMAALIFASEGKGAKAFEELQLTEGLVGGFSPAGIDSGILVTTMKPESAKHIARGVFLYINDLVAPAAAEFKQAIAKNPRSFFGHYWLAQTILSQGGDMLSAQNALQQAVTAVPAFFSGLYSLAELNLRVGKQAEALALYQKALAVKSDAGVALKLGAYYEAVKDYRKAEQFYRDAIRVSPDLFLSYNQLAWLFAKQGKNLSEALELVQKANILQPGNKGALDTLGWIYFQQKKFQKSFENLERANEAAPDDPTVLYHLGAAAKALGKKDEARGYLEKALKLAIDFDEAQFARDLLQSL